MYIHDKKELDSPAYQEYPGGPLNPREKRGNCFAINPRTKWHTHIAMVDLRTKPLSVNVLTTRQIPDLAVQQNPVQVDSFSTSRTNDNPTEVLLW